MNTSKLLIILKGMAMGMAEIVPGVSGGTIAFITGIYETLLESIANINLQLIKTLKEKGFGQAWQSINGNFLLFLFGGMILGIVVGVLVISHFLDTHPTVVWALFFGIIFASVFYIGAQIRKWNFKRISFFVIFCLLTLWVTNLQPAGGSENYLIIFASGFIAISALMLPGVSGSFMLLLMGMYSFIVHEHLKNLIQLEMGSLLVLLVFGLGCLTGMFTFARLLQWTFKNYRENTLAALTGILLGSLYKIWPWRNPVQFMDKKTGELLSAGSLSPDQQISIDTLKIVKEANVLPGNYIGNPELWLALAAALVGLILVWFMHSFTDKTKA